MYGEGDRKLKFEIDDTTGMIEEIQGGQGYLKARDGHGDATLKDPKKLEQILQAVKKTQDKIHTRHSMENVEK